MTMMQRYLTEQQSTRPVGAPAPTRHVRWMTSEQHPDIDFSSLIGPLNALESVIEQWSRLTGALLRSVMPPHILPLPAEAQTYERQALRVAVVRHEVDLGPTLVRRLRNQLSSSQVSNVVVEAGYFLSPCSVHYPLANESWSVRWETRHLNALRQKFEVSLATDVLGAAFAGRWELPRRIVLIDTGDEGAISQTGFDMESTRPEKPSDHHGHGTSVASLIRLTAPQAEVHSYRVMRRDENFVESSVLLNAVTSATATIGVYHIVAIPYRATLSARARGQCDAIHEVVRQNAARGCPTPVVVCAAGNVGPREGMDYPATVPGVLVALGLDWSGQVANYNCRLPSGTLVHCVGAMGGIEKDPLGSMVGPTRLSRNLYGSSYATALVAGALASTITKS